EGWLGNRALSGSEVVSPAASTTYILTCKGSGGSTTKNVVLAVSSISTAGTFFVAPNGNDSNPGNETAPFRTLQKAIPLLKPGNTLFVRGGEYDTINGLLDRGSIIPSGTSWDQAITIKAYPGEKPVFRRYVENATCCTGGASEAQVRDGIHLATPEE